MNYYDLREIVKDIVPRRSVLENLGEHSRAFKEKGRKVNYREFKLDEGDFVLQQKLLKKEQIDSFLNISVRAPHCPLPLNSDVWDSTVCPFNCAYCLPPTSKVLMYDGTKKMIGRIKKGDRVISVNTDTWEIEISEVTKNMRRKAPDLVAIKSGGKIIKLTPEHPVFTNRGWIKAENLTTEDMVLIW